MITSGEVELGDSEGSLSLNSNRKDNTQTGGAFIDMSWGRDRNGMLKGGGHDDLMHGGNGDLTATSQAQCSEDAGDTQYAPCIECEIEAPSPTPPQACGNRDDRMVAIRQMLSDLKEDADIAIGPEVEERAAPAAPEPSMRERDRVDDDDRDQLGSRIDDLTKAIRAANGRPVPRGYDAVRLRRSHETRAKKLQRAKGRREKSGAFMTGFTLVSVVTATMVGFYILHPQIIAASPQMAPAINEYVVTVDRYRVEGNETAAEWKAWLAERIGKLTGKEE
jgi:hypothetical protein